MYPRFLKRIFDFVLALIALVVFSPFLIALAAVVAVKLGKPIIYVQERAGLNGKPFRLYKFRSMTNERNESGELLGDDLRLTRFGQILRSTSLDELPSLLNIVLGQLSVVGPRPLPVFYIERYSNEQRRRLSVRPGLTGLAQVSGRNALDWENKFELDLRYVAAISFAKDIQIIWKTVFQVFRREGIAAEGHVTAPEFLG